MTFRTTLSPAAVLLLTAALTQADPALTDGLTAVRDGAGANIRFAVAAATDVEVAVVDADGNVVRHLAAGMLGKNAPAPLKKDSLKQAIAWDGKDDLGRPVDLSKVKVRVRVGSQAVLERVVGWDGATIGCGILAITVGAGGELYVLDGESTWGMSHLRMFGPDGKYRQTIMPYPADTPAERTQSVGHLDVNGERIPIVFSGHGSSLYPLVSGMKNQTMAFSPKGHLLVVSAGGTIVEHGPPRHLLAFHPKGGAPAGVSFVGPQVRKAKGFLGGSGEGFVRFFDHLATSPDGEWIYFVPCGMRDRKPRHAVYRLRWTDKKLGAKPFLGVAGQSGKDDEHFNDPQGVAVDAKGRLYVCDRGNDRVMVFSAGGKLTGRFEVPKPEQIGIGAGGEIYILSRARNEKRRDRWSSNTALLKFAPWSGAAPRQLAKLVRKDLQLLAVDRQAKPAKLWVVASARNVGQQILPVADAGGKLTVGEAVNTRAGLRYPMFLAADPARGRVLLRERFGRKAALKTLDVKTGKIAKLPVKGADLTVDRDGNIYTMDGYGTNSLSRYDPAGKPLSFAATGSHKLEVRKYRGYGPDMGLRGHCVDLAGNVYLIRSNNSGYGGVGDNDGTCGRVDAYSADGKLKADALINGLGHGDCGLGVDAAGNLYVGINIKPADAPVPDYFAGKVSTKPWVWWRSKRDAPWKWPYYNPYLYHLGAVVKFGPAGGKLYGFGGKPRVKKGQPTPKLSPLLKAANAPAGAAAFRSGYLKREIKVLGAKWLYAGAGVIPTSDVGWGDPSCVCVTSHLAVDGFGRVFAPNVFRFCVEMIDTAGNAVARIGRYGNADGNDGKIAFAWPNFISVAGGKVYVADPLNQRVSIVRFKYAAEATVGVK